MSMPTHIVITKRKVSRKIYIPNGSSWRDLATEYPAKFFRFYEDRTVYRRGQLEVVFNLDGKAIEGWSYWTCIYCYAEPSEDFPQGRLIYNQSGYGSTTGKHIYEMMAFFSSPAGTYTGPVTQREYRRIDKVMRIDHHKAYTWTACDGTEHTQPAWEHKITRPTRAYTSKLVRRARPGDTVIEQICWGRGATPDAMRERLRRDMLTSAQRDAEDALAAQQAEDARVAREARWARMEAEAQVAAQLSQAEAQAINEGRASSPALRLLQGGA